MHSHCRGPADSVGATEERGLNKKKSKAFSRTTRLLIVMVVLAAVITALTGSTAVAADRWSDMSDNEWVTTYGVTAAEVATVAEGYGDGTFRPSLAVTRAQFSKMVVDGLGLAKLAPASPSFSDVLGTHFFFEWIEGAAGVGIMTGYLNGTFGPAQSIARQEANSVLGRYLSEGEIAVTGGILGDLARYPTLAAWYAAEGAGLLASFADAHELASTHAPFTAYLIYHDVVWGSSSGGNSYLKPVAYLSRAQAAALILRVKNVTFQPVQGLHLSLTGIDNPSTAGVASNVLVRVLDEDNMVATGYRGTIHFTSTDPAAVLPANYTFTAADAGAHTFLGGVTLKTAGSRTVTATDTVTASITGSQTVTVLAGALHHFGFAAIMSPQTVGTAFAITITARDAYDNVKANYSGSADLTDTTGTISPVSAAFVNGVFAGTVTISAVQTGVVITATDNSVTGESGAFNVDPIALTVTGALANDKPYDGTTAATVNFLGASLVGIVGTDVVTLDYSGYGASFASAAVGTGKPVTVTGVALSGADAGNYTVSQPSGLTAAISAQWFDSGWSHRRQITINHTAVDNVADPSTAYADFPVLVSASGLSNIKVGGADIRFTSSDGVTELPREIETYSSGTLYAWVKVTLTKDASDSTDDIIYMYYGNALASEPAPASTYGAQNVWASDYMMVQHMQGTSYTDLDDSTSNNNDVTTEAGDPAYEQPGQMDYAVDFDGSADYVAADDDNSLDLVNALTISGWFYFDTDIGSIRLVAKEGPGIWSYRLVTLDNGAFGFNDGLLVQISSNGSANSVYVQINGALASFKDEWVFITTTYDGSTLRLYVDAGSVGSNNGSVSIYNSTARLGIGASGSGGWTLNGLIDEVRVSNTARSANWIRTCYNNQNDAGSFMSVGSEEGAP